MSNRSFRARSTACLLVLGGSSVLADPAPTQAPIAQRASTGFETVWHFKQPRNYTLDVSRVAVFDPSGARIQGAVEHVVHGWSFITVPEAQRTPAAVRQLVRQPALLPGLHERAPEGLFVSPVMLDDFGGPMLVRPEIIVRFEDAVPPGFARERIGLHGAGAIVDADSNGLKGCFRLRVAPTANGLDVIDAAARLAADPLVRFAEPDMVFTGGAAFTPNDPLFPNCWGLHNIGQLGGQVDFDMDAPEAWNVEQGSPSVVVAVLDTGIDLLHPDINLAPGTDVTGQGGAGAPMNPCDVHGTAVGGCVSARINNALGTVGIAPGVRVASVRTFISNLSCDGSWSSGVAETLAALEWCALNAVKVTNNSNYYGFSSSAIDDLYTQTRAGGMVHFAAAGNFAGPLTYPSTISSVNSVAALARTGLRAGFSNFGDGLDFSAPGQDISTCDRTGAPGYASGDYVSVDGTSFASPYLAGLAALVLSHDPTLLPAQVEGAMRGSCLDLGAPGYDTGFGWGMPNAYTAMTNTPPPPPPAPGPFSLLTPANAATNVTLTALLDWSEATNAVGYVVTLDDNLDFSSPIFSFALSATEATISPGTLVSGRTYYWKVSARNAELLTTPSTPASAHFTTIASVPPCLADMTGDGAVDVVDLVSFLGVFGTTGAPGRPADLNADGSINVIDLTILLAEFGRTNCP